MDKKTIGILGGMGSYATLDIFKRFLDAFPAEKEWDRPRIIIDNRCTMPSRVRAILYGEKESELIDDMSDSIKLLVDNKATHIVLACNTSHIFLDKIYKKVPDAKNRIVHIIEKLAEDLSSKNIFNVFLLASEGTIESKIYSKIFSNYNIDINYPEKNDFVKLREFIEAVKQNKITDEIIKKFCLFINNLDYNSIILGCTELPILYSKCSNNINKNVFDPINSAINFIVNN